MLISTTARTCHQSLAQLQQRSQWTAPRTSDTRCKPPPETWWPRDTCMRAGGTIATHLPVCEHGGTHQQGAIQDRQVATWAAGHHDSKAKLLGPSAQEAWGTLSCGAMSAAWVAGQHDSQKAHDRMCMKGDSQKAGAACRQDCGPSQHAIARQGGLSAASCCSCQRKGCRAAISQ